MLRSVVKVLVTTGVLLACGGKEPAPAAPATSAPATSAPAEVVPAPETPAEPAKRRKPFEIHSACTEVVTVGLGDDPKAPIGGKRTLATSATIEGDRNADGDQTVWLYDGNGEPLVKVNVTRGMKRVEVGRSCRTLDAR